MTDPDTSSMSSGKHGSHNMLLVSQHQPHAGGSTPSSSRHNKFTRKPRSNNKLKVSANSTPVSGLSSPASSSSALVFDNLGQAHDPSYVNALREQLAIIGESASASKKYTASRRRPVSAGKGSITTMSERSSALGLGMSSHFAQMDLHSRTDSSDTDDDDDDSSTAEEDGLIDGSQTLSTRARSSTQTTSIASHSSAPRKLTGASMSGTESAASHDHSSQQQSPSLSVASPPRSPTLQSSSAQAPVKSASAGTRHLSFSASASNLDSSTYEPHRSELRAFFGRRESASLSHSKPTFLSPVGSRHPSGTASATQGAHEASGSGRRKRSPLSSPSNSRPTTADKDEEWGFTGIVDVERLRQAMAAHAGETQCAPSLFDEDETSESVIARSQGRPSDASKPISSPGLSELVHAASLSRSSRTPSLPNATTATVRKNSLLRKDGGSDAASTNSVKRGHSLCAKQRANRSASSSSRPSSSGSNDTDAGRRPAPTYDAAPVGMEARATPRYRHIDGDRTLLSTIPSGKTITATCEGGGAALSTPEAMSSTFTPQALDKGRTSILAQASSRRSLDDEVARKSSSDVQRESKSHDPSGMKYKISDAEHNVVQDTLPTFEVPTAPPMSSKTYMGSSASPSTSGSADTSAVSHELRRKVEVFAMGVRFSAFKAKRKLARGMAMKKGEQS